MPPKVSVIVPVYNSEQYLNTTLDSLINQTLKEIEIICIDDGSTDNSLAILKSYEKKDHRITVISQENQGVSAARNKGISISKADYIMFCDSDDWYKDTMCAKMYHAIRDHKTDFACCSVNVIYNADLELKSSDKAYYSVRFTGKKRITTSVISKTNCPIWNKIFKKSLIQSFDIKFPLNRIHEDYVFFFQYASLSKTCYFINEKLYNRVRRPGSIMNTFFKENSKALHYLENMEIIWDFLAKNHLQNDFKTLFLTQYIRVFKQTYHRLPDTHKVLAFKTALPMMRKFSEQDINKLSRNRKRLWVSILNQTFPNVPPSLCDKIKLFLKFS